MSIVPVDREYFERLEARVDEVAALQDHIDHLENHIDDLNFQHEKDIEVIDDAWDRQVVTKDTELGELEAALAEAASIIDYLYGNESDITLAQAKRAETFLDEWEHLL